MNARMIEKELGRLLFTGQCEKRAYNSGQWTEAKFPKLNLKVVLPKILKERNYTDAILQARCNDISNIGNISQDKNLQVPHG